MIKIYRDNNPEVAAAAAAAANFCKHKTSQLTIDLN
jgi:hypothetical protein